MILKPSVCVIIPAYNAAETIESAVRSALAEPEVAEVVVVDDASDDDTVARVRGGDDSSGRLKVLIQAENQGPSAARNRAIRESMAPWIALLDADDFFLPRRIAGLLAHGEEADLVADDLWQVEEDAPDGPRDSLLDAPTDLPRRVCVREFVLSCVTRAGRNRGELSFIKPLIRRSFLMRHCLSYREDMRLGEDYELYARALAAGGRMILVPALGYVSVIRPGSLSGRHTEADLRALRDCNLSIQEDFDLSREERGALSRHSLDTDCRLQWRLLILAVNNRDAGAAITTFLRPWRVPLYLVKKLGQEVMLRCFKKSVSRQHRSDKKGMIDSGRAARTGKPCE